jgi:hypothetical protein
LGIDAARMTQGFRGVERAVFVRGADMGSARVSRVLLGVSPSSSNRLGEAASFLWIRAFAS